MRYASWATLNIRIKHFHTEMFFAENLFDVISFDIKPSVISRTSVREGFINLAKSGPGSTSTSSQIASSLLARIRRTSRIYLILENVPLFHR